MGGLEPRVRSYLSELIERAKIVPALGPHGKLPCLSLPATRRLYRDVQYLLEPPALSWRLLKQIEEADLALATLSSR